MSDPLITAPAATPTMGDPRPPAAHRPAPRWAVIGIFVLLAVAGLAYAKTLLTPILLAFVLALVFSPLRRGLERLRLPPGAAAAVILTGLVAVLLALGVLLTQPVRDWTQDAPAIGAQLEDRVRDIRETLTGGEEGASITEVVEKVTEAAAPTEAEAVPEVVVREDGMLTSLAAQAPAVAVQMILTLVLLFFVLASGDMFYEKIVHVLPRLSDKRRAIKIARDMERKISRYLLTITLINAGLGVSVGLAMWALGMPDPLLFGVAAFLLNYVPYLGAIVGAAMTLVVGLLTFDTTGAALAPALVYYTLTSIEGQVVTPWLVGRNLKLNAVVVFIAVAFWAWLWSVVGMLIAVPLLVALRVLCEHIPALDSIGDFLSARGAERATPAPRPEPGEPASEPARIAAE